MKFLIIFLAVSYSLGLVELSFAQKGKSQSRQKLADKMIADARLKNPDEKIRQFLQNHRISKEISIGPREIQVHRFFIEKSWVGPQHGSDWRYKLMVTDAVVIGKVDKIIDLSTSCGYNTAIQISVERFIKGHSPEKSIKVKLISGKVAGGINFVRVTSEPKFQVGERILIFLGKTPSRLHLELSWHPCPDNIELWYKTEADNYFEPGYVKYTIDSEEKLDWPFLQSGEYDWYAGKKDLSFVIEEIQKSMRTELSW